MKCLKSTPKALVNKTLSLLLVFFFSLLSTTLSRRVINPLSRRVINPFFYSTKRKILLSLLILAPLVSLNGSPLLAGIKRLVTVNGMIVDWIVIISNFQANHIIKLCKLQQIINLIKAYSETNRPLLYN